MLVALAAAATWLPAAAAPGTWMVRLRGLGRAVFLAVSGLFADDVALQADGKIVVVGKTATKNQLAVARYLPNGQPDTSFDGDGIALYADMFEATDVALQRDGRIVIGGTKEAGSLSARTFSWRAWLPTGRWI